MAKKKNPLVFMDVSIDGDPIERMVFEVLLHLSPVALETLFYFLFTSWFTYCFDLLYFRTVLFD